MSERKRRLSVRSMLQGYFYEWAQLQSQKMREIRFRLLVCSAIFDVLQNLPRLVADFQTLFPGPPSLNSLDKYAPRATEDELLMLDRYIYERYFTV